VFSKDRLALFNLTAHELHELYYDKPTVLREALDRLRVRLNMCLVYYIYIFLFFDHVTILFMLLRTRESIVIEVIIRLVLLLYAVRSAI